MKQDSAPNSASSETSDTTSTANSQPEAVGTTDLPALLQNTDALEALMKRAAGQLN